MLQEIAHAFLKPQPARTNWQRQGRVDTLDGWLEHSHKGERSIIFLNSASVQLGMNVAQAFSDSQAETRLTFTVGCSSRA